MILMLCAMVCCRAQSWTVWYGTNLSNEVNNGELKHWHYANGGVDYTRHLSQWDLTLGAGLSNKGGLLHASYAQLEGNAGYRFLDTHNRFSLSALTGPFFGVKLKDTHQDWIPNFPELRPVTFGWQAGVLLRFRPVALKVGYERALMGYYDKATTENYMLPTSAIHSLFLRVGVEF